MMLQKQNLNNTMLSIVIPCYNEEDNINIIVNEILKLKLNLPLEIIFVDDGSSDNTWYEIEQIEIDCSEINIVPIRFSKNFGKEAALESGLQRCKGDIIITIDCDLQHPVEIIPKMIELYFRNYDVHIINAIKKIRQEESIIKTIFVSLYYFILKKSTNLNLKNHSDFKLIDRFVLKEYLGLSEKNKFYRGLIAWLGFHSLEVKFIPKRRKKGNNSWSFWSLLKYAKNSVISFSYLPLKFVTWLGFITFIFSIVLTIDTLINKFNGSSAEGFPTVILLQLGIGSLILFSLGIIADYLSEIYKEIKNRPSFVLTQEKKKK